MLFNYIYTKIWCFFTEPKNPILGFAAVLTSCVFCLLSAILLYKINTLLSEISLLSDQIVQLEKANLDLKNKSIILERNVGLVRIQTGSLIGETRLLEESLGLGLKPQVTSESMEKARLFVKYGDVNYKRK